MILKNNRKGWIVVLAGTGINLAFGVLYAWSIFSAALQETHIVGLQNKLQCRILWQLLCSL